MPKKLAVVPEPFEVVDQFMLDLTPTAIAEFRKPQIRASSMPLCPILFTLNSGHGAVEYPSAHYFRVGTAIHDLIQTYAANSDVGKATLWGDWKCSSCNHEIKGQLKPVEACPKCHSNDMAWIYVEVTIEYEGISGHIDTILKVGPDEYVIVDYKTTSAVMGKMNPDKYPFRGNVLQISLYAFVMKEKYGLNIVGWSLCYVQRDKPIRTARDFVQIHHTWTKKNHKNMRNKLAWVSRMAPLALKMWSKLHEKQKLPDATEIQTLIDARPCQSMEQWEGWMKAGWEREFELKDRVCEHLGVCLKGGKSCTKHFTKLMQEQLP